MCAPSPVRIPTHGFSRFVAAEQDLRHLPTLIVSWTGVDRRCEDIILETVTQRTLLVADHPRHHTNDGIGNHRRHQFTTSQHEVANRDLLCNQMITHTLVDAFIVTCKNNQIPFQRQFVGHVLVETLTVRRGKNHLIVVTFCLQGRDTAVDGLTLHHHSCTTSVRIVVHATPFVKGIVTQVVQTDLCQSFLLCPCQYALMDEAFEHLGQHRYNIYSHK